MFNLIDKKYFFCFVLAVFISISYTMLSYGSLYAATYYVDANNPLALDSNSGTESKPLKSVRGALNKAEHHDTIYIKPGIYDLNSDKYRIDVPLSIIGENPDNTILINGSSFIISESATIKNITFKQFQGPAIYLSRTDDKIIDGVTIDSCKFSNMSTGIRTLSGLAGLKNVTITNCDFTDMTSDSHVLAIRLSHGETLNITVSNNNFNNLVSANNGSTAIMIGENSTRDVTSNIKVLDNDFYRIHGFVGENLETKAIIAYGTNIEIANNRITELNAGQDHEAIYLKANHSVIRDNVLRQVGNGVGGGDIAIKGGDNVGNTVIRNIIISDLPGRGMLISGQATIESNYIRKPNASGIYIAAYDNLFSITDNVVFSHGRSISLYDGSNTIIKNNHLTSTDSTTIGLNNSDGVKIENNIECAGSDCVVPGYPLALSPSPPFNLVVIPDH